MSSITGPFDPSDLANVSTPFDLTVQGVSPTTALVEARGDNGLLLPCTLNPKEATAGTVVFQSITSLTGTGGATYAGGSTVIQAASSLTLQTPVAGDHNYASAGGTSIATTITTGGASLIVALVTGNAAGAWAGGSSGVSGGTLGAFTKIAGGSDGNYVPWAEIWIKASSGSLSGETVTASFANNQLDRTIQLLSFTGAHATQDGAVAAVGSTASPNFSRALSATYTGSYILAAVHSDDTTNPSAAGTGTTLIYESTFYATEIVRSTSVTSGPGSVTLSLTGKTTGSNTSCMAEIRAA